ncbi:MAG: glycosyltransferase family 4 protein, partial [Candidatus Omnitrophica bacterium]|nr:glycosyltransferase family 4 protein [Candidatus Omnitrophota bacterium]
PCGKNIILIVASGNPLNIFSVNKFIKEIWPKIQKRIPDARLRIAGPICKVLLCGVHAGVELVGYVENIADEYSNALVVVNPVVAGTGLKIKSLEALAYGKALLSTPAGVEGLPQRDGELFLIAHEPADFISGIEKLIKNKQLQETLENNARLYSLYDLNHNKVYRELSNMLQDHFFDKDKTQESYFHGMAQQHIAD